MTLYKIFLPFSIAFLSGVLINNYFWNSVFAFLMLLFLVAFFCFFSLLYKKYFFSIITIIIGLCSGLVLSFFNIKTINTNLEQLQNFPGKPNIVLEIRGIKSIGENGIAYTTQVREIESIPFENTVLFETTIRSNFRLKKGEIIQVQAKIYPYKNTPEFKYKFFMLSSGYYAKIFPYTHERIGEQYISDIEKGIIALRERFINTIKSIYPKEEGIFLGGILFGAREEIPKELKTNFNHSGLTHFIAVSGFNITILIVFFGVFIKFLPAWIRFSVIVIAIVFFTYLVGPSIAVVRASIMGIIGYLALTMGRKRDNLAIILATALLMVCISPLSISYDVSFHLSFLAVLGIVYFQKYIDKKLSFIPEILELRSAIVLTLSALILTFPIMVFSFGQVSTPVLLTNILVSWTIPFAMLFGFLSILGYMLVPVVGIIIGFFAYVLLAWDIWVVNFFGSKDWSIIYVNFGAYSGYFQVLYLIIMCLIIVNIKQKEKTEK